MEVYGYNTECECFEIYLLCNFRGREDLTKTEVSPLQKKATPKAKVGFWWYFMDYEEQGHFRSYVSCTRVRGPYQ